MRWTTTGGASWSAVLAALIVSGLAVASSGAGCEEELLQKMHASDASHYQLFGQDVTISGEWAVVGAPRDNVDDAYAGAAYVFRWDGAAWIEMQKLSTATGGESGYFGAAVAIDGDAIVIGAAREDVGGVEAAGAVYVYRYDGSSWQEEQKLTRTDPEAWAQFGVDVAISGNALIAGTFSEDYGGLIDPGSAYIYRHDGASWVEEAKFITNVSHEHFGQAVDMEGDLAVVGAPVGAVGAVRQGDVHVFRFDGVAWDDGVSLSASEGAEDDRFGHSVALDGDTILVGAIGVDAPLSRQGAVYAFREVGGDWGEPQVIHSPTPVQDGAFGSSLALSGDVALTCSSEFAPGDDATIVYALHRSAGGWVVAESFCPDDVDITDAFGLAMALEGSTALIANPSDNDFASHNGAVYAYELTCDLAGDLDGDGDVDQADLGLLLAHYGDDCRPIRLTASDGAELDYLSWGLATDGATVLAGAPRHDHDAVDTGSAYAFARPGSDWIEDQELLPVPSIEGDYFGVSLSLSNDVLAVGAPRVPEVSYDDPPYGPGAIHLYANQGGGWVYDSELMPSDSQTGDCFGWDVAIDGNSLITIAPSREVGLEYEFAVYIFQCDAGLWSEVGRWGAAPSSARMPVHSVALAADMALVGYGYSNESYVTPWFLVDGAWGPLDSIHSPGDWLTYSCFGQDVATDGARVAVGAPGVGDADWPGRVYVYERSGFDLAEQAVILPVDTDGGYFGAAVAVSGSLLTVGDPYFHDGNGAVHVYRWESNEWSLDETLVPREDGLHSLFGSALALRGQLLAIGAVADDELGANAGACYVVDVSEDACLGDLNGDRVVDQADLGILLANYGSGG